MDILEAAEVVKDIAVCIAKQKKISIQEAYTEALQALKEIDKNKGVNSYEAR